MQNRKLPSKEILQSLFTWDDSGILKWKISCARRIKIGQEAGYIDSKGYGKVIINGIQYFKHRILYFLYHNIDPLNFDVDHIDTNPKNNAKSNLRLGTTSDNCKNTNLSKANSSGCKGVSFDKLTGKWHARIMLNGKSKHLGFYQSFIYACVVRKRSAKLYFGDWRRE